MKNQMKIALCALIVSITASLNAGVVSVAASPPFPITKTDLLGTNGSPPHVASIAKFNATVANCPVGMVPYLQGVSISFIGNIVVKGRLVNSGPTATTATAVFTGPFQIVDPANNSSVFAQGNVLASFGAYSINAGQTIPFAGGSAPFNVTANLPSSVFSEFTGTGSIALPIYTFITQTVNSPSGGNINLLLNGENEGTWANVQVIVTYSFDCIGQAEPNPHGNAPESPALGMVAAACSLGLLGYRHAKGKR